MWPTVKKPGDTKHVATYMTRASTQAAAPRRSLPVEPVAAAPLTAPVRVGGSGSSQWSQPSGGHKREEATEGHDADEDTPVKSGWRKGDTYETVMMKPTAVYISAPMITLTMLPRPPEIGIPPTTTAAIESRISGVPAFGSPLAWLATRYRPATAARPPQMV